jgi:hypothetical protein
LRASNSLILFAFSFCYLLFAEVSLLLLEEEPLELDPESEPDELEDQSELELDSSTFFLLIFYFGPGGLIYSFRG